MTVTLKDFSADELLFLKKIISTTKRHPIDADIRFGEPDFRIVEEHDVDRFSFVWDLYTAATEPTYNHTTIIIPHNERNDIKLLKSAHRILTTMAELISAKKSPVISRLNHFVYKGLARESDLHYAGTRFFQKLYECYTTVDAAWCVMNGEFTCNHDLLNSNRVYHGEFAYSAEELYEILGRAKQDDELN